MLYLNASKYYKTTLMEKRQVTHCLNLEFALLTESIQQYIIEKNIENNTWRILISNRSFERGEKPNNTNTIQIKQDVV